MTLSEHRTFEDAVCHDGKRSSPQSEGNSTSSRPVGGQRICIDALCRSPLSPRALANIARPKEAITPISIMGCTDVDATENGSCRGRANVSAEFDAKSSSIRYFSVHLVVAAVAEGDILSDHGARKTKCVLDQLTRNVSKEQNQVVVLPVENSCIPLKLRVFVKASLEAKALNDYISRNEDQRPAPFVILSRGLHMAVSYDKDLLDPSEAGVADRFRKQAKTRAVKLIKEALENPALPITSALLRGHMGANSPALLVDPFLEQKCVQLPVDSEQNSRKDGQTNKSFIFEAKHKKGGSMSPQLSAQPEAVTHRERSASPVEMHLEPQMSAAKSKRTVEESASSHGSSYFPVTLYITAVGDGTLAKDVPDKARERLESILTKIPKEQQTTIECGGSLVPLKLRVFVANSEDAKAVGDYIQHHPSQVPAAVVLLCREVMIALRCEGGLDMRDSSVADRLRKQAKTRAVKLVRDLIVSAKEVTLPVLRGQQGPLAPSSILEPMLASYMAGKGEGSWSDPHGKKFVMFSAKNKFSASPAILPESPKASSPDPSFSLEPAAVSPVITSRFMDRKLGVTIDVNHDRIGALTHGEVAKQYTPSSLEAALLLDSCRILACGGKKEEKNVLWGNRGASELRQGNEGERGEERAGRRGRSLVEGCWRGLEEPGQAPPGSSVPSSKRLRMNPG